MISEESTNGGNPIVHIKYNDESVYSEMHPSPIIFKNRQSLTLEKAGGCGTLFNLLQQLNNITIQPNPICNFHFEHIS